MSCIHTRAGTLHVTTVGSGPPALLWHSMLVDSRQWLRVQDALAEHRTLVIVDGPGHGRSGRSPTGTGLDECAAAAVEILDVLGLDAVDWVGNAWGGHVGFVVAADHPGRCRTLTAVAAPPTPLPKGERRRIALLLAAYRLVGAVGPLRSAVVDGLLSAGTRVGDPDAVDAVAGAFAAADRIGLRRAAVAMMLDRPDVSASLGRIAAPTLLVAGTEDAMWPPDRASATAHLMPHARSVAITGAAHLPPLESPAEFVEQVLGLWRVHDRADGLPS